VACFNGSNEAMSSRKVVRFLISASLVGCGNNSEQAAHATDAGGAGGDAAKDRAPSDSPIGETSTDANEGGLSCGDNHADPGEICDGSDLRGVTCETVAAGFKSGTLSCNATCTAYVTTACAACASIDAPSVDYADVSAAVASANDCDTVHIPAGSATWSQ